MGTLDPLRVQNRYTYKMHQIFPDIALTRRIISMIRVMSSLTSEDATHYKTYNQIVSRSQVNYHGIKAPTPNLSNLFSRYQYVPTALCRLCRESIMPANGPHLVQ